MWQSENLPGLLEMGLKSEDEYTPPEKKQKEYEYDSLKEALESCRNHEIGIEEASLIYGIPKSTLRAELNDINCLAVDENYRVFVLSVYPPEAESDLVSHLQDCLSYQVILTATEIRRLAYELICEKYKVTNLPREKNCLLGQRWYRKFIEKYPHLLPRNPRLIVNEEKSLNFYNNLEKALNNFHVGCTQIYAVDGVDLKFRASCTDDMKILPERRLIYANAKAVCCINPTGDFVPPVFLQLQKSSHLTTKKKEFPEYGLDYVDKKSLELDKMDDKLNEMDSAKIPISEDLLYIEKEITTHLDKKLQPMFKENGGELKEKLYDQFVQLKNKTLTKSENPLNQITPEIFHDWFVSFLNHVKPNPQRSVLLLLSDQNCIKSYKILELAKKNSVIFLVLPPHSTHKIYPLDGFAKSLNRNLSTCTRRWMGKNPDFRVQQVPLYVLFMEAFNETVNPLIAKNGFLYSGIWPINRDIFQSSELGGESVLVINKQKLTVNENCSAGVKRNNLSSFGISNEADLKKLCRVCIKEKMYMKPLLESIPSQGPNYYGKKISEISQVVISHGDGLPAFICQYCLVQLMDAVKIKEMAVDSHKKQQKLREALDRFYFEEDESENQDLLYLFPCATSHVNDSKTRGRLMLKNFDMNSICRICMGEKPLMTSIFFRPQNGAVSCSDTCSRIMEISHYQAHIHDGLSLSICPFCRASIYKASDFIRRVTSSDKLLREIISSFRTRN